MYVRMCVCVCVCVCARALSLSRRDTEEERERKGDSRLVFRYIELQTTILTTHWRSVQMAVILACRFNTVLIFQQFLQHEENIFSVS